MAQSDGPAGIITTIAGYGPAGVCGQGGASCASVDYGAYGYSGDGGPAIASGLFNPRGVAVDSANNIYVTDTNDVRIRKITAAGLIYTIAGTGNTGFSGDGGPATAATLNTPWGIALDTAGNVFFSERANHRVRRVALDGTISTAAGTGVAGHSGDGGPATLAQIGYPTGLTIDAAGNLFFCEDGQDDVRKVDTNGVISTVAGNGSRGFGGDGGPAVSAMLDAPEGVTVDAAGDIFIADTSNSRVRKVTPDGMISTIAGNGTYGFAGDGGPAPAAALTEPMDVKIDTAGNLLIADGPNGRIRKVTPDGVISTIAGGGAVTYCGYYIECGMFGDGGPATSATVGPAALAVDRQGNLLIVDTGSSRLRKVTFAPLQSVPYTSGASFQTQGTLADATIGYADVVPNAATPVPSALAIFGFRQNNVLISEATVPASDLIQAGQIYAESNNTIETGMAFVNPSERTEKISFLFYDSNGLTLHSGTVTLPARAKIAAFLNQPPFNGPASFSGSFVFNATAPIAAIALRGLINERAEFLMTTIPVTAIPAGSSQSALPVTFAQFADGGGWTTGIELVNSTNTTVTGSLQFLDPSGSPAAVTINGTRSSRFSYSLAAGASQNFPTSGSPPVVLTGSVRAIPSSTSAAPTGVAVFSFRNQGITVSAAGVPASVNSTAFRVYAENSGVGAGSIETAIAVANNSSAPAMVTAELLNLDGSSTGLTGSLNIAANGQVALFLNQIPGLTLPQQPFRGVLRVTSSSSISVIGLRGRYNERGDFLITTTSPTVEGVAPTASFFPHVVDSGGFTTQFVLFDNATGQSLNGTIQLFSFSGGPTNIGAVQ